MLDDNDVIGVAGLDLIAARIPKVLPFEDLVYKFGLACLENL